MRLGSWFSWHSLQQLAYVHAACPPSRGFIFCTSGRKRETLTGDATVRYFDYLQDFAAFEGILVSKYGSACTTL